MNNQNKDQNKKPTQEIKIEGVGSVKVFGTWDAEKLINRLLESDSIRN